MGTAFDDFIKEQQHKNASSIKPYSERANFVPRSVPKIKKTIKKYSPPSNTEFSGKDFEPRAAHGYPKGALNVLIVFFATFFEEILDIMKRANDSGVLDD